MTYRLKLIRGRFPEEPVLRGRLPTLGTLRSLESGRLWTTVERPWLDNKRNVSCIPAGTYRLRLVTRASPPHDRALLLLDVPGRDAIMLHAFNWCHESKGCIGPGISFNGTGGVSESRRAMAQIIDEMDRLGTTEGEIEILDGTDVNRPLRRPQDGERPTPVQLG